MFVCNFLFIRYFIRYFWVSIVAFFAIVGVTVFLVTFLVTFWWHLKWNFSTPFLSNMLFFNQLLGDIFGDILVTLKWHLWWHFLVFWWHLGVNIICFYMSVVANFSISGFLSCQSLFFRANIMSSLVISHYLSISSLVPLSCHFWCQIYPFSLLLSVAEDFLVTGVYFTWLSI